MGNSVEPWRILGTFLHSTKTVAFLKQVWIWCEIWFDKETKSFQSEIQSKRLLISFCCRLNVEKVIHGNESLDTIIEKVSFMIKRRLNYWHIINQLSGFIFDNRFKPCHELFSKINLADLIDQDVSLFLKVNSPFQRFWQICTSSEIAKKNSNLGNFKKAENQLNSNIALQKCKV